MIMALIFSREDIVRDQEAGLLFTDQRKMHRAALILLLVLVLLLLSGTLKLGFLTDSYGKLTLLIPGVDSFQNWLFQIMPFDAGKGEEGVTAQGAILIVLLSFVGLSAWKGLQNIIEGFNGWTWASLILVILTMLTASVGMQPHPGGLDILLTGKFLGVVLSIGVIIFLARYRLEKEEVQNWLWESWRFIKQIFPLLIIGVFIVGVIRQIIRPEWIESLAGKNTILGNLAGVVFGVFMYFPTLVEVPIAKMFLTLGMHRGPLLAYLMADPELSLQSILIISTIIGRLKAWTYVGWVALFSMLAGLIYGSWVDGSNIWHIAFYMVVFLSVLAFVLYLVNKRNRA